MSTFDDIMTVEQGAETEEDYYTALQRTINQGTGWKLQGSFGRTMMDAIEAGRCMLGTRPTIDYWGNRIPSRFEVQEGTKGSRRYVIARCGEDWADMLEALNQ